MHFRDGIDAYFLRGCVQYLGMQRVELEVIVAQAKKEVQNRSMHSYILLLSQRDADPWFAVTDYRSYNVYGRKSETSQ